MKENLSMMPRKDLSNSLNRRAVIAAASMVPFIRPLSASEAPVSRVMVQGQPHDTGSSYKVRAIMPALDALGGVRKMRCRYPPRNTVAWQTYSGLAAAGVKFCFTVLIRDPATLVDDILAFERQHPGSVFAIEFPNEPDLSPVNYKGVKDVRLGARTGNAPALLSFCRDVTTFLSDTPELSKIPRVASNDWMQAEQSDLVSYANSHIYPKPTMKEGAWLPAWQKVLRQSGKSRGMITEWGRTTGGDEKNVVAPPISLDDQARLIASDLKSILGEPTVAVVSLYELFSWPGNSEQNNFGLFNADLTPRPVVGAIRSLLR